jgi:cold shock CspA family protein
MATGAQRSSGKVTSWRSDRGYGYIEEDGSKAEHYVNFAALVGDGDGFKDLAVGQEVEFDVTHREDGRTRAENVTGRGGVPLPTVPRHNGGGRGRGGGGGGFRGRGSGTVVGHSTGRVVSFRGAFGFIEDHADKAQHFVHFRALRVEGEGFKDLAVGQEVEFDVCASGDGSTSAENVTSIGGAPLPSGRPPQGRGRGFDGRGRGFQGRGRGY